MKIISIDVGIRNLAICFFEVDDKQHFKILEWTVVNLCDDALPKCCGIIKKKKDTKQCDKNARYRKNDKNYCKTHAKKTDFIIPTTELYKSRLTKYKIAELFELCNKYDIGFQKPIAKPQLLELINIKLSEKFFEIIETKKADKINLTDLGKNLMDYFDNSLKISTHTIDYILIENQISTIATRMKTLQGMITQYFIMRGSCNIEFISSSNKLKPFLEKKKTSYAERKKMGITITKQLISESSYLHSWIDSFENSKKKDDLADCFLQGLWFMNEHNLIQNNNQMFK